MRCYPVALSQLLFVVLVRLVYQTEGRGVSESASGWEVLPSIDNRKGYLFEGGQDGEGSTSLIGPISDVGLHDRLHCFEMATHRIRVEQRQ